MLKLAQILTAVLPATLLVSAAFAAETFHHAPENARKNKNPFGIHDPKGVDNGAKLYSENCASCHGGDALGMGNIPSLARGAAQNAPDGELFWFITNGSPQNGMPPAALSETERWEVISFLKSLAGKPARPLLTAGNSAEPTTAPAPAAPFTDFRFEAPGVIHKIEAKNFPEPAEETSVGNGPEVVARPTNAWPKVPPGFKVQLFASGLDNPRLLRTAPNGDIFLAESNTGKLRVFRGIKPDGTAQQSEIFAKGLNRPYGIAFYPPGPNPKWIYVGEVNEVVRLPYNNGDLQAHGEFKKVAGLPANPRGHWTRDLQFSADGKRMFVAVGSASNVDDADTSSAEKNRAAILSMTPEGGDLKVYASGIRNAGGGLAIQPGTGDLWCSSNERDGLGDNLVADYITHVKEGGFYGWPWWYIGGHQDPRHRGKHPELKGKLIQPDVLLQAHHASLQLSFYQGQQFPKDYQGDIFSAQHGSWNRSVRTGYSVIRVPLHGTGKASGEYEDFMTGFVIDNKRVWGRPVGVTVAPDGSLLVSDDGSNSIWRVIYNHPG